MKKSLLILSFALSMHSLLAQESIIKEFAEPRRPSVWMNPIALYPSTLRMVNIAGDTNYYKLVNEIEKVLIYTLDSATFAEKNYSYWLKEYEEIGYEEYISLYGPQTIRLIGKDDEYVGLLVAEEEVMAFYIRGQIPFQKIPALMESFRSEDILSTLTDRFK